MAYAGSLPRWCEVLTSALCGDEAISDRICASSRIALEYQRACFWHDSRYSKSSREVL